MRRFSFLLPLVLAATLTGCGGPGEIPQSGGAGEMDLPDNSIQIQITDDPVQEELMETAPTARSEEHTSELQSQR